MTTDSASPMLRMPVSFGPSLGPRQGPDGTPFFAEHDHDIRSLSVTFETDESALVRLLPPGLELEAPRVTVLFAQISNIDWLAGRGYNLVNVNWPVTYRAPDGSTVAGDFASVLWENMADPIITGREDMGYPKVFADLSDISVGDDGSASANGSWDGFTFLEMGLSDLQAVQPLPEVRPRPMFVYKYFPTTGRWGESDVAYLSVTPPDAHHTKVLEQWSGQGQAHFNAATWEQLPTLVTIVNKLAELPVGPTVSATMTTSVGGTNFRKQRALP